MVTSELSEKSEKRENEGKYYILMTTVNRDPMPPPTTELVEKKEAIRYLYKRYETTAI
jgi:hypothetical protein